ncbi:hypothetical protein COL922a_013532 [Colletotrichum nupharicola]|nr:hypothetical protein COL922a_013532 [Colletotrichum nupharicola]
MSASASQSHFASKEAISVVESFEKAAQFDMSSITAEAQVDNSSPSLRQQISLIKNMENLLPALIGFLGDAQPMETTQVTPASSKL